MAISSTYKQRGVALVVSLVMLVVITLLGVAAMSGSRLEWLMASNTLFQTDAAVRVESALRDGETAARVTVNNPTTFPWGNPDEFFHTSSPGDLLPADPLPADPRNPANWNSPELSTAADATTVAPAGTVNKYLVEYMGCSYTGGGSCPLLPSNPNSNIYTYRIWAYSADNNKKGGTRIAQSTFTMTDKVLASSHPPPSFARIGYAEIYNDKAPNP